VDGAPRYVTALGRRTDVRDGWRAEKPRGGCILDIPSGEIICRGLSMPHSRAGMTAGCGCWNPGPGNCCLSIPPPAADSE